MAVFSFEYVDSIFGVCPTLASIILLRAYRLILRIDLPSGRHMQKCYIHGAIPCATASREYRKGMHCKEPASNHDARAESLNSTD